MANSSSFAECVRVNGYFGVVECIVKIKSEKKLKNLCEKGQFIDKSRNRKQKKDGNDQNKKHIAKRWKSQPTLVSIEVFIGYLYLYQ